MTPPLLKRTADVMVVLEPRPASRRRTLSSATSAPRGRAHRHVGPVGAVVVAVLTILAAGACAVEADAGGDNRQMYVAVLDSVLELDPDTDVDVSADDLDPPVVYVAVDGVLRPDLREQVAVVEQFAGRADVRFVDDPMTVVNRADAGFSLRPGTTLVVAQVTIAGETRRRVGVDVYRVDDRNGVDISLVRAGDTWVRAAQVDRPARLLGNADG